MTLAIPPAIALAIRTIEEGSDNADHFISKIKIDEVVLLIKNHKTDKNNNVYLQLLKLHQVMLEIL